MTDAPDFIPDSQAPAVEPNAEMSTQSGHTQGASAPDFIPDDQAPESHDSTLGAAAEGVAKGVLGPLAPLAERHLLHIPYSEQRERAEAHPIIKGAGEAAGLLGSMVTGVGEGALLSKAGETAQLAAGLSKPVAYAARVGSSAVQQAAEMAILQGSDEIAKRIMQDPNTSSESAIANIGLAAALGGAGGAFVTGVVSPLWKATVGSKIEGTLKALQGRLGGVEDATEQANGLAEKAGLDIPDHLKAVIDGNPTAQRYYSNLSQNDSAFAGRKLQEDVRNLNAQAADKIGETLGRTPQELANLERPDKYTTGRSLGESIQEELRPEVNAISAKYDQKTEAFKNTPILDSERQYMADQIAQKAQQEGWSKAESSGAMDLANRIMKKLPEQKNVNDLKQFVTNLRQSNPFGSDTYQVAKAISSIISDAQELAISSRMGTEEFTEYQALKSSYKNLMNKIDNLNEHLHVGRYEGPQSFMKALDELSTSNGEAVLNRLSGKNKANVLEVLQNFPKTLAGVKDYHVNDLLSTAASKAEQGSNINVNNLLNNLDKMSPQLKELVVSAGQQDRLQSIAKVIDGLKDSTHNWSNTARTIHKLTHDTPSAISLALGMATGHTGAGILAHIAKLGFNEGNAGLKLGIMKFLGSSQPVEAQGFKSMIQLIHNSIKAQQAMAIGAKNLFKPGAQVLAVAAMPDAKDREKLSNIVDIYQQKPEKLMDIANAKTGHYLPDHQAASAQTVTSALNYLQQIKPQPHRSSPLDREIQPSAMEMARYNRALDIANNPLIVLQHVKDGTIKQSDILDLKNMYPSVYAHLSQQVSNAMTTRHAEDGPIPYKTRMGISMFLGQAVDSTMLPTSIVAAQPIPQGQPASPRQPAGSKGSPSKVNIKTTKMYQTPDQTAQADRANRD